MTGILTRIITRLKGYLKSQHTTTMNIAVSKTTHQIEFLPHITLYWTNYNNALETTLMIGWLFWMVEIDWITYTR